MPRADYNKHVLDVAKRLFTFPIYAAIAGYGWANRRLTSPASRRAKDQLQQSRVRRRLRGLSDDHDPAKVGPY